MWLASVTEWNNCDRMCRTPHTSSLSSPMADTTEEESAGQQTMSNSPKMYQHMATKPKEEWAVWSEEEVGTYLQFLFKHCSEMGDGSNFKKETFSVTAEHIEQTGRASGGEKDWKACRSKWQKVCGNIIVFQCSLLILLTVEGQENLWGDWRYKSPYKMDLEQWDWSQYHCIEFRFMGQLSEEASSCKTLS